MSTKQIDSKKEFEEIIEEIHSCGFNQRLDCKWLGHNKKLESLIQKVKEEEKMRLVEEIEKLDKQHINGYSQAYSDAIQDILSTIKQSK